MISYNIKLIKYMKYNLFKYLSSFIFNIIYEIPHDFICTTCKNDKINAFLMWKWYDNK